jgi:uncharacterized protein YpuA (DUF1002 family)
MKRKILIVTIILLLVATGVGFAQKGRVQWEYKVVNMKEDLSEERLNALGADGWQIIPMRTQDVDEVVYYFQRQK